MYASIANILKKSDIVRELVINGIAAKKIAEQGKQNNVKTKQSKPKAEASH